MLFEHAKQVLSVLLQFFCFHQMLSLPLMVITPTEIRIGSCNNQWFVCTILVILEQYNPFSLSLAYLNNRRMCSRHGSRHNSATSSTSGCVHIFGILSKNTTILLTHIAQRNHTFRFFLILEKLLYLHDGKRRSVGVDAVQGNEANFGIGRTSQK